jgi:hypothetical protein
VGKSVFPLMFMFREKLSQVPPVPDNYNVMLLPLRITFPPSVVTVYNKLTGAGGCWRVSIQVPSLPGPALCCLLSFLAPS